MDFRFTDDQLQLAETVRDYLSDTHGTDVLRRLDEQSGARDPAIWQGLMELGLGGILVPESYGGLGLGLIEAALVAREAGRVCLSEPLVDIALTGVAWLLRRNSDLSASDEDMLRRAVEGQAQIELADAINPWLADPVSSENAPLVTVDPLRRLSTSTHEGSDPVLVNLGALMSAAQLVGLAEAMLDQAVAYAKLREQFGQPIGSFQAVKHQLANCALANEFARPVLWRAAQAADDALATSAIHVSHAKVAATDAAMLAAETAIQVHGAMGYTYEVDLHFWMKRTWALAGAWGSRAFHISRIDDAIMGGTLPVGPEHTFA